MQPVKGFNLQIPAQSTARAVSVLHQANCLTAAAQITSLQEPFKTPPASWQTSLETPFRRLQHAAVWNALLQNLLVAAGINFSRLHTTKQHNTTVFRLTIPALGMKPQEKKPYCNPNFLLHAIVKIYAVWSNIRLWLKSTTYKIIYLSSSWDCCTIMFYL